MGPNVHRSQAQAISSWKGFLDTGELPEESAYDDGLGAFSPHKPVGAVAGEVELEPGEEREVRFALLWYFPYHWIGLPPRPISFSAIITRCGSPGARVT